MSQGIITTKALRKEYFETVAVNDVDLEIPQGEVFGFIGPNGAGKTTILRMLATTLEPTSGQVLFEGRDIWKNPERARANIGFMPDFFQMYDNLRVRELLTYFGIAHGLSGRELRLRVDQVVDLTDLVEKRDGFVKGLSRGMMQRLGLGRAILHRPKLLLLDEPASGLDPLARRKLFEVLREVHAAGATIVISSHILGELSELCTSVAIMHEGRFLEVGRTEDIIRKLKPKREIVLRLAGGAQQAAAVLARHPAASEVKAADASLRFLFDGDDAALAALNAELVGRGAGVALMEEAKTTLHEVYFAIAERGNDAARK